MLRILSWNSNTGFEKMPSEDLPNLTHTIANPLPQCGGKRKRPVDVPSVSSINSQAVKALVSDGLKALARPLNDHDSIKVQPEKCSEPPVGLHKSSSPSNPAADVQMEDIPSSSSCEKVKSCEDAQLATMRQTISSQLSLEILTKHRELRLIDQELAKCQVALEQLRRCTEIPYPALRQPSEQVSLGQGPAVRKPSEKNPARSPAPWGVTDGPYTRHYARWLLPDHQFDGSKAEMSASLMVPHHGRSTRGVHTDFAQMVGKTSRSQRALYQGLPAGFCEPKQKPTGPMILKRKSDGKMVKLVCPDCGRFDFGSAQGFINHCRIGHQRNYASHDAAAEGCGEPMEVDDAGLVKDAPVLSAPPSVVTTPIAVTPSPIIISATTSSTHPLVKTAHLTSKDTVARPIVRGGFIPKSERKSAKPRIRSPPVQNSDTPHLSALVQSRGTDINLEEAVAEAKRRDDLHEEWEFDAFVDFDSPLPTPKNSRHPHVAGKKPSGKSVNASSNARKPAAPNQVCASMSGSLSAAQTPAEEQSFHHFMPLVPSPTNESTQAPSLIDDDEEMDPQSPPSSDEHDETDVHFDIRDDDHSEEHHELRGPEMTANATPCSQTATTAPPFARPLSSKGSRPSNFVAETSVLEGEGDKKRRRIEQ